MQTLGSNDNMLNLPYRLARSLWRKYRRWSGNRRLSNIVRRITQKYGLLVSGGPFAGTIYQSQAIGSAFIPKLVGSYEAELHPLFTEIINNHYQTIIDVGCAEGYYAIGLARLLKDSHVYAYDTDPVARKLCQQMANANAVADRVTVAGQCDAETLAALSLKHTLLISDCEGYELELLSPNLVPGLAQCDVLVELHDCFYPGLTEEILSRFNSTHDIKLIDTAKRNPEEYPVTGVISPKV